jgi:hypothetical protein
MANMYPKFGSKPNNSPYAEAQVYNLFKEQLDDNFYIIHSIPWLSSVVQGLLGSNSPIGEVDFLIFHPQYGALAIEVKGGRVKHDHAGFFYTNTSNYAVNRIDPVNQLTRGVFALQKFLEEKLIRIRIGKAYFFPNSETILDTLPPGVVDLHANPPVSLVLDIKDTGNIKNKILEIMEYHKKTLGNKNLNHERVQEIISKIVPDEDYTPCWLSRIDNDGRLWLKLTDEQKECIDLGLIKDRLIVTGWPGSGKTIVATHLARLLSQKGNNVLIVTFNKLLAEKFKKDLKENKLCKVFNFHSLCKEAADWNKEALDTKNQEWLKNGSYKSLEIACDAGFLGWHDALIVDEGQVIKEYGWKILVKTFSEKKIATMCDMKQAFSYEEPVTLDFLTELLSTKPFFLTNSLRLPKLVCNRLKLFQEPEYSVINQREIEDDTLSEIVVVDEKKYLELLFEQFECNNIPFSYMVILYSISPPSEEIIKIIPKEVKVESIGRFRGLESPFVIILASKKMSDIDFFCAYSRATTRCVVILNAYAVKEGGYGKLGSNIYSQQQAIVDAEANKVLTNNIISELSLTFESLPNCGISLKWCVEWGGYIFPVQKFEIHRKFYENYFSSIGTPRVYTWTPLSVSYVDCKDVGTDFTRLNLEYCSSCNLMTPHFLESKKGLKCYVCNNESGVRDLIFEGELARVGDILKFPKSYSLDERKGLSPYLFALGGLLKYRVNLNSSDVIKVFDGNSSMANVAIAFIMIKIIMGFKSKQDFFVLKVKDVAKETQEWNSHVNQLSFESWQGFINAGFNKMTEVGILIKSEKGLRRLNGEKVYELVKN